MTLALPATEAAGFIDLEGPGWGSAEQSFAWTKRSPNDAYPEREVTEEEIARLLG